VKILLSAISVFTLLIIPASAQTPEPTRYITICNDRPITYIFEFEPECPDGRDLQWIVLWLKGPRDIKGEVAYEVIDLSPRGYMAWSGIVEAPIYWDMKYATYWGDFAVSYTVLVTDVIRLPDAQTIDIKAEYGCELTDGIERIYPVRWRRGDCTYLPLIMSVVEPDD
jgi:hypothetical protein